MLLETSNTTSNFANRPHIKKGYYPGKLLKVQEFTNRDGSVKVCKHGKQLIMDFEVWSKDENDAPVEPILFDDKPVVISKFVYHIYKITDKDTGAWTEGEFKTAITPNSKITEILEALGWKFSEDPVDPEEFVGRFAELNINDYEQKKGTEDAHMTSSIADIGQMPTTATESTQKPDITEEARAEINKLEESKKNLDNLKESGDLTEDGYTDAIEQIEHDIKKLKA